MAPTSPRRRLALLTSLALFAALSLAALPASASNAGTVKVQHPDDVGDPSNEPHVGCEFFVEGFNMDAEDGTLVIKVWAPTDAEMTTVVLEDTWTMDDGVPENHFLNGPYSLPDGHYKVFASDVAHDKMKVFWVECDEEETPTETTTGTMTNTTTDTSTEIPVFPSAAALVIGVGGAVVGSLFMLRRRL